MIYVFGSINMDLVATVPYMPAAGETLTALSYYVNPGGKGANQAVAIAKLGGAVRMIGKVGADAHGDAMKNSLTSFGVDAARVGVAECASGTALILVEKGDNRIILSPGANYALTESDVDAGLSDAAPGDMLIMQLEVPLELVEYAAAAAKKKGMTVLLNPAPAVPLPDSLYAQLDIVAPNETETKILTGIAPDTEESMLAAAAYFTSRGVTSVILTLGSRGAAVYESGKLTLLPPRAVKVVDTTSAGDTFIGACAVRFTLGDSLPDAGRFATVASSITITRPGAAASIPTLNEVEEVIHRHAD